MTELTPPPAKANLFRKWALVAMLGVGGLAVTGYIFSKAGLDKALVKQELDAWIAQTESRAKDDGYDVDITYDDVIIKGGLTDGRAEISRVALRSSGPENKDTVTFATPKIILDPQGSGLSNVHVILPDSIRVFEGKTTTETAEIASAEPMIFAIEQFEKGEQQYQKINHTFPSKITMKFLAGQEALGAEEKTPNLKPRYDTIELHIGNGAMEWIGNASHSDVGSHALTLSNVKIVPVGDEIGTISVESFKSSSSNTLDDKNLNNIKANVELTNLSADEAFMPYAPIHFKLNAEFDGAMPSTPQEFAKIQSQQTSLKLKEFSFSTKDASLNATADFVANQDDILPVGMANISIGNVQSWREMLKQNKVIDAKDEELANTLFIRIAGQTLPDAKDVSVDIQRAREGSFQIGGITFEELLAIFLGNIKTPLDVKLPEAPVQAAPVDEVKAQ